MSGVDLNSANAATPTRVAHAQPRPDWARHEGLLVGTSPSDPHRHARRRATANRCARSLVAGLTIWMGLGGVAWASDAVLVREAARLVDRLRGQIHPLDHPAPVGGGLARLLVDAGEVDGLLLGERGRGQREDRRDQQESATLHSRLLLGGGWTVKTSASARPSAPGRSMP